MEGFSIDLTCVSKKPVAIHGQRGIIEMGGGGGSFYYSKTRMDVEGTLTVDGTKEPVTGMALPRPPRRFKSRVPVEYSTEPAFRNNRDLKTEWLKR